MAEQKVQIVDKLILDCILEIVSSRSGSKGELLCL